ncbi:MAG: cellulase family glycosylhydrolase [Mariniphaga sp.]
MRMFILACLLTVVLGVNAQNREKAFAINEKLGRGINYGNMFESPSETNWGNPWKPEYAGMIADLGFNHVRIPIRWEPAERSLSMAPYIVYESFLNRIKQVVDSALNNGLYAIINMHHHDVLYENPDAQRTRFLAQWEQISKFFKDYPDSLLFEILNEPHGNLTADKWNEFYPEALAIIRKTNPERIVLIGTPDYGGLGGLSNLQITDDPNIILTVHYYNPFQFTHQGASWVGGDSDSWLGTEWKDTEPERNIMRQDFAPLEAVENQYNIPVHIGEFGAYSTADMKSRAKWTTFLTRSFEKLNWSWAYWEFSAGFGIYNPSSKTYNQALVDALLHNEMPEPGQYVGTPLYSSDFQNGNDGWNLVNHQGASSQLSRTNNILGIDINNGGTAGWHVQLQRGGFSFTAEKKYRYTFKAKAASAKNITTYIGMTQDPWSAYSGYNPVSLADTFAVYSFIFDMNITDSNARMVFDIGNSETDVSITDIRIEEVTFQSPTEINTQKTENLLVFPNPAGNNVAFSGASGFDKITVFNILGKPVAEKPIAGENNLDISELEPGLFFFRFTGNGNVVTKKILKRD